MCEALGRPIEEWDNDNRDDEDLLELLDHSGCRRLPTKVQRLGITPQVDHSSDLTQLP